MSEGKLGMFSMSEGKTQSHMSDNNINYLREPMHTVDSCRLMYVSYQCTNARLEYMRSNLWSSLPHASAIAVVLLSIDAARFTCARSPPVTTDGGW